MAALAGAAASAKQPEAAMAHGAADSPVAARAPQPIPAATGAVWGHGVSSSHKSHPSNRDSHKPVLLANSTPHAVLRSFQQHEREREAKHWDSKGKQVVSSRATCPSFSFHNGPSGRVLEEKGRCREIGEHPMTRNPGPQEYDVDPIQPVCMVPKGMTTERRFRGGPFDTDEVDATVNPTKLIKFSTEAHPFSLVYPYADTKPSQVNGRTPDPDFVDAPLQENSLQSVAAEPVLRIIPQEASEDADRKNPIRTADLNCLYFKYKQKPTFGFGSSGLGFRFRPGSQFARKPAVAPHQRLRGFRERRDLETQDTTRLPWRSYQDSSPLEKHYQAALQKALDQASEAQAAAAAAASAASEATPAPARSKERTATEEKRTSSKERTATEESNSAEAAGGTAAAAIANIVIAAETAPVAVPDASKEVATPT